MKKVIFPIIGCVMALQAIAQDSTSITDASKTIMVQKGQKDLILTLKSNRSTGYSWFLKSYDTNLLQLESYQYNAPSATMPGAPGAEQFHFKVKDAASLAPQSSQITLSYARPWEMSGAKATVINWVTTG